MSEGKRPITEVSSTHDQSLSLGGGGESSATSTRGISDSTSGPRSPVEEIRWWGIQEANIRFQFESYQRGRIGGSLTPTAAQVIQAAEQDEEFVNVCGKIGATVEQAYPQLRTNAVYEWCSNREFRRTRQRCQEQLHASPSKGFGGARIPTNCQQLKRQEELEVLRLQTFREGQSVERTLHKRSVSSDSQRQARGRQQVNILKDLRERAVDNIKEEQEHRRSVQELLSTTEGYLQLLQSTIFDKAPAGSIRKEDIVQKQRHLQIIGSHFAALTKSYQREVESLDQIRQADRKLVPLGENECFFCGVNLGATDHFDEDIELAVKASEEAFARERDQRAAQEPKESLQLYRIGRSQPPPPPSDAPTGFENEGSLIRGRGDGHGDDDDADKNEKDRDVGSGGEDGDGHGDADRGSGPDDSDDASQKSQDETQETLVSRRQPIIKSEPGTSTVKTSKVNPQP